MDLFQNNPPRHLQADGHPSRHQIENVLVYLCGITGLFRADCINDGLTPDTLYLAPYS